MFCFFYNEEIFFTGGSGLDDLHEAAWWENRGKCDVCFVAADILHQAG